jgi:CBS domain containing-hemolysin-like protein
MFAVPESTTLAQFNAALEQRPFSRVPIYRNSIDHISGIAFAHDLLRVPDTEASTRTVATIARPVTFVPETKKGYELLREMQVAKQHMCIVIDEYGGVAGLVTIEDLLEEIVGNITDEHERPALQDIAHREGEQAWRVHGTFELARLPELFGDTFRLERDPAAKTVGGLVSEVAGRIPLPGEIVEGDGMRMEVLASTGRRVESVRLSLLALPAQTTENVDLTTEAKAK